MGNQFAEIAFTQAVQNVQLKHGSRENNARMTQGDIYNHLLGETEVAFITERDSFYMSSVSETGWPYIQHRGGPVGFVRVLDEKTIGLADFSGNRQYVSTGNFMNNNRVAIIFMDYPNRRRLKLLGQVRIINTDESELLARLEVNNYGAIVERGFLIDIDAFDWNCPQHITPRYTESYIEELMAPLIQQNQELKLGHQTTHLKSPQINENGPLELVVSGIRQLTPRVRAYEFSDPDGAELPPFEAGSHLQLSVLMDNGELAHRHYSISSNPARRDSYEIAVLLEDTGTGGSSALHEHYYISMKLRCELPKNQFHLHDNQQPTVLFAGGIGITPIKAMSHELKSRGNDLHIHYAGRSKPEMAFKHQLELEFADNLTLYSSFDNERMDIEKILLSASEDTIFYVCGPERLIDAVIQTAKSLCIDPKKIRFERFKANIDENAKPIKLKLRSTGKEIRVSEKQTVLDAILDAGIETPYSCRSGTCKTCAVKVLDGEPEHKDLVLSKTEREDQQLFCPCISRASSDHLTLDI